MGDGLGIPVLQGHGIIVAWASPARRHGARTPSSTVEEREGKEICEKNPGANSFYYRKVQRQFSENKKGS